MQRALYVFLIFCLTACKEQEPDLVPKEDQSCPMSYNGIEAPYDDPIWHPDGKIIGFNHNPVIKIRNYLDWNQRTQQAYVYDNEASGFWIVNSDGSNPHRILECNLNSPAWSPDGKWIAFVNNEQIFKMPFDGEKFITSAIVQLTFGRSNYFPSWSPDGQWIAYDSNNNSSDGMYFIWKMKSDGSAKQALASVPLEGATRIPSWSKDFSIIYQKYKRFDDTDNPEIFAMDGNGSNNTRLTYSEEHESYPKFSPDGQSFGYISYSTKANKGIELYVSDRNGNTPKKITDGGALKFSWSPNSEEIVYVDYKYGYVDEGKGALWIINVNTLAKRQLTFNDFILIQ